MIIPLERTTALSGQERQPESRSRSERYMVRATEKGRGGDSGERNRPIHLAILLYPAAITEAYRNTGIVPLHHCWPPWTCRKRVTTRTKPQPQFW